MIKVASPCVLTHLHVGLLMDHITPEAWLAAQPLFPYRSRESLVKAAWAAAIETERAAVRSHHPAVPYEVEERDGK